MNIEIEERAEARIVAIEGVMDLQTSGEARAMLLYCVGYGRRVDVDLSAVTFMDTSGVASLVEAFSHARKIGGSLGVRRASPAVQRVIEMAQLDRLFDCEVAERH